MKQNILIQSPVEIENQKGVAVSVQLARTTITDANGEKEICPEICLLFEKGSPQNTVEVFFNTDQADRLIHQLQLLRDGALAYEGNRLNMTSLI